MVHLDTLWREYQYLYGESEERLEQLNRRGRWFFGSLQRLMVREIILSISRLTDSRGTGDQTNLVLEMLLDDPLLDERPDLQEHLEAEIEEVRALADPIRRHRHKSIAHLDLAVAMGSAELPALPKELVNCVIGSMQRIHRMHYLELYNSDVSYELHAMGTAEDVVRALEDAAKWQEHERREEYRRYGIEPPEANG